MTDLAEAAWDRLTVWLPFQDLVLSGLIGTDAADDDPDEDKVARAWVFQGFDANGRPYRNAEGSGKGVVVLSVRDDWAEPNRHNTWDFPLLQMLVYMDSDRDADGTMTAPNAVPKCRSVMRILDRRFHLVGNTQADQDWPGLRVHSCIRASRLTITDVPDSENGATVRGEYRYEVTTD